MEKILQNRELILNFLEVATQKGLINQDIREIEERIEKSMSVLGSTREDIECEDIDKLEKEELKKRLKAHNEDLGKVLLKIEDSIGEYKGALKKRYLEYGAILHEVEEDFFN